MYFIYYRMKNKIKALFVIFMYVDLLSLIAVTDPASVLGKAAVVFINYTQIYQMRYIVIIFMH